MGNGFRSLENLLRKLWGFRHSLIPGLLFGLSAFTPPPACAQGFSGVTAAIPQPFSG